MNIRSIQKNFDDLIIFLRQFSNDFDIIVLSETYQVYDLNLFDIDGYDIIYNHGNNNRNDGILIYIKKYFKYNFSVIEIAETKALEVNTLENENEITLTVIYRSPNTCPKRFNSDLLTYLKNKKRETHIITGDINIDLLQELDYVEEYKNALSSYDFVSYINQYTRPRSKTCLDHFFIKSNKVTSEKIESCIFNYTITDHYPIAVFLDFDKSNPALSSNNLNYSYKQFINYNKLKSDLILENWNYIYEASNVHTMTELFTNTLNKHIEKNTRHVKIKKKCRTKKPWITQGLVTSINHKNELYKKLQFDPENATLKHHYTTYKNRLNKIVQKTKRSYIRSLIEKNNNTSKNLWDCVNKICGKSKSETIIDEIENQKGDIITDKILIANEFNNFFSDIGKNLAEKISSPENFEENINNLEQSIFLFPTNESEVIRIIKSLKNKKSPGGDNLRAETLKEISNEIATPMTFLINKCFETGCFPNILKIGLIKPLFKTGTKTDLGNYRPISLISNISKIVERAIKNRLVKFLNKYHVISDCQYGFREGRSTEDAICLLTSKIYKAIDSKTPALCIFVDLSKAFDTVYHGNLLKKLHLYGIRGNAFSLIKSYLSDRQQQVCIDGVVSEMRNVTFGVPQGTVLGPLLFNLYINSLLSLGTRGLILSFADDTAIFYESKTWNNLKEIAESDFRVINDWFKYNKLTLNIGKTKYLPFTSYKSNLPSLGSLNIDPETLIPESESMKYLGIVIDRHLRWDLQLATISSKLKGLLSRFKFLKEFLDVSHLKTVYYSLIQSQLSYGILGWGGVSDCHLTNANTVQKWIIRIIYDKDVTYPSNALFEESGLFDIRQLFALKTLLNMHQGKLKLESVNHTYQTRNKKNTFAIPKCEKRIGQRSLEFIGTKIYNSLPDSVKSIQQYSRFKIGIKRWLQTTERNVIHNIINSK